MKPAGLRLGVNIDHVATIRNARGGGHPDPVRAARLAAEAGADGITAHLREDRRHISDRDIERLSREIDLPLNLEMAATEEMLAIALKHKPHAACLVPEKREERTTEGGLDVRRFYDQLEVPVRRLLDAGIRVSLFIEADRAQLDAARKIGAPVVELHTGAYCEAEGRDRERQLERLVAAAAHAAAIGLECHAGHGLTYDTVAPVAAIPTVAELNIGHFLVGEAIFVGFESSIRRMRALMDEARAAAGGKGGRAT
jgi:pyridoxine 5-phosphate synthase